MAPYETKDVLSVLLLHHGQRQPVLSPGRESGNPGGQLFSVSGSHAYQGICEHWAIIIRPGHLKWTPRDSA